MAEETNQKIDEMLRACAQKRGDGPGAPLHPATRRMLHDEVRRVHGPGPARARTGWALWWPRLAFGASLCLVAGLTLAVLKLERPPEEKETMAASSFAPAERSLAGPEVLTQLPAPGAGATGAEAGLAELPEPHEAASADDLASQSLSFAPAMGGDAAGQQAAAARETAARAELREQEPPAPAVESRAGTPEPAMKTAAPQADRASAAAPAPTSPKPEALLRAAEMTNLGAALRTHFVQTNQLPAPVLRSFQMEQLGDLVKFMDVDGSVYTGQLQRVVPASGEAPLAARNPRAPGALFVRQAASNSAVFSFTASGVNRTLGSPVTVEGEYFSRTNRAADPSLLGPSGGAAAPRAPAEFLFGRTLIGGTNEAPLRAISVER
jgi:hypothetical protein